MDKVLEFNCVVFKKEIKEDFKMLKSTLIAHETPQFSFIYTMIFLLLCLMYYHITRTTRYSSIYSCPLGRVEWGEVEWFVVLLFEPSVPRIIFE